MGKVNRKISKGELMAHKLKGEHDFKYLVIDIDKISNKSITTTKCEICGFVKEVDEPGIIYGSGMSYPAKMPLLKHRYITTFSFLYDET